MIAPKILKDYQAKLSERGAQATEAEAASEIHAVITDVSRFFANKTFGFHTSDDVVQTAYLLALEAVQPGSKYDPARGPLRHFLATHVRRRLANLSRSEQYRPDRPCTCCDPYDPPSEPCRPFRVWSRLNRSRASLASSHAGAERVAPPCDPADYVLASELDEEIRERLAPEMLGDYEALIEGGTLSRTRKKRLAEAIFYALEGSDWTIPEPEGLVEFEGRRRTLAAWTRILGERWGVERLQTSLDQIDLSDVKPKVKPGTVAARADEAGLPLRVVTSRMAAGMTLEEALESPHAKAALPVPNTEAPSKRL